MSAQPQLVNGIPHCSKEECEEYDGKRCFQLGFRPDRLCEPAVVDLVLKVKRVEALPADLRAEIEELVEQPAINAYTYAALRIEEALKEPA